MGASGKRAVAETRMTVSGNLLEEIFIKGGGPVSSLKLVKLTAQIMPCAGGTCPVRRARYWLLERQLV